MRDGYSDIGAEIEVIDASPHRLVQMLLDRCVQKIHLSKHFMETNEIQQKCQSISKAIDIIAYLKLSLNFDNPESKELSLKLDDVYSYIDNQLLQANITNDPAYLDAALNKLLIIKSGWDALGKKIMNKYESDQLEKILNLSNEIFDYLKNYAELKLIYDKLVERNQLAVTLIEHSSQAAKPEIISQLLDIRDRENELLNPYRDELKNTRRLLINLKNSQQYIRESI